MNNLTFMSLQDVLGNLFMLAPADEPRVDAAVLRFIDSGGRIDTILDLTSVTGAPVKILASCVHSWTILTPDTRRREVEFKRALDTERAEHLRQAGVWGDE